MIKIVKNSEGVGKRKLKLVSSIRKHYWIFVLIFGLVAGYLFGSERQFDASSSADKIEYLLHNIDDIPIVSNYINSNSSISDIQYFYDLKSHKSRPLLEFMVAGLCLS